MPCSVFKKLDLGDLRPTTSSPQLVDCYVEYHLGILEDICIKLSDFHILMGFLILDMIEDAQIQIIFERF